MTDSVLVTRSSLWWTLLWRSQGFAGWNDAHDWLFALYEAKAIKTPTGNFLIYFPNNELKTAFMLAWMS